MPSLGERLLLFLDHFVEYRNHDELDLTVK